MATESCTQSYFDSVESVRFWTRCIMFARHDTTTADLVRWARNADEATQDAIGFASRAEG